LLVDEICARRAAIEWGIDVIGTLRILAEAKRLGQITVVRPIIAQMQSSGYRSERALIRRFLERIGEGITRIVFRLEGCPQTFSTPANYEASTLASDPALG
jgi:hypothetical protein